MKTHFFLSLFILCSIALSAQITTADKKQKIDAFINYLEENNQLIGSIAINENGTNVYSKVFGYKNLAVPAAPDTNQTYQIGSITKMFTAVILAKLQEQGKLKFTDKLALYFPDMPRANDITLKQMLNHTSGMQDMLLKNDSIADWLLYPQTPKELLAEIKRQGLAFEPGAKTQYSNSAYYLLARIVEQKTKLTYADAFATFITKPLQMNSTQAYKENSVFKHVAVPYEFAGGNWNVIKDFYFYNASGVGDVIATPADLNLFMEALFNGKVLKNETLQALLPVANEPFGLGIMTIPFYQLKAYGHGGDTMGTHSVSSYFKENDLSITYMVNGQRYETNDFAIGVLSILYDKPFEYPVFTNFKATPAVYDRFTGTYANPTFPLDITITNKGTFLQGQGSGQPSFPLEQTGENTFAFKNAELTLVFHPESNTMDLTQSGYKVTMTRK